jgi:hypothetical protein
MNSDRSQAPLAEWEKELLGSEPLGSYETDETEDILADALTMATIAEAEAEFAPHTLWLLAALQKLPSLYHGTVSYKTKVARRIVGKRQRAARRLNRG